MDFETKQELFDFVSSLSNKLEALENSLSETKQEAPKEEPEQKQEINEIDDFLDKKGVNA